MASQHDVDPPALDELRRRMAAIESGEAPPKRATSELKAAGLVRGAPLRTNTPLQRKTPLRTKTGLRRGQSK
jgi:hypothetical protein